MIVQGRSKEQICSTGTTSAAGVDVRSAGRQQVHGDCWKFALFADRLNMLNIVQVPCFDPTWLQHPLGFNFAQQGPNLGPTWTHLALTSAHFGSNIAQLDPKFKPFASNFGSNIAWSRLRATLAQVQVQVHMSSMWDTWPPNRKPVSLLFLYRFSCYGGC